MANQLHNVGEEFERRLIFEGSATKPANVSVGLYHDGQTSGDTAAGDDLADAADVGDITTEPTDGNYSRQTVPLDDTGFTVSQNGEGNWQATATSQITFDTTDTTGDVDSYFVTVSWDQADDGTPEDHLYFSGALSQLRSLGDYTELNIETVGLSQD